MVLVLHCTLELFALHRQSQSGQLAAGTFFTCTFRSGSKVSHSFT